MTWRQRDVTIECRRRNDYRFRKRIREQMIKKTTRKRLPERARVKNKNERVIRIFAFDLKKRFTLVTKHYNYEHADSPRIDGRPYCLFKQLVSRRQVSEMWGQNIIEMSPLFSFLLFSFLIFPHVIPFSSFFFRFCMTAFKGKREIIV